MFFRRSKKPSKPPSPSKDDDGYYYVEEGEEYNSDEFETDSEYSYDDDNQSGGEEEGIEAVRNNDTNGDCLKVGDNDEERHKDGVGSNNNQAWGTKGDLSLQPPKETQVLEGEEKKDDDNAVSNSNLHSDPDTGTDGTNDKGQRVVGSLLSPTSSNQKDPKRMAPRQGADVGTESKSFPIKATENVGIDVDLDADVNGSNVQNQKEDEIKNENDRNLKSEEEQEQLQILPSLSEQRSLVALAAQHDRVDILNSILHPKKNDMEATSSSPRMKLLLNNLPFNNNQEDQEQELEDKAPPQPVEVFIPPLHVAIAASSVQAASCLLRMGANPSIRPDIPNNWDGPGWRDEKGDLSAKQNWSVYHGVSAWELAFGIKNNGDDNPDADPDTPTDFNTKGWLSGWVSPSKTSSSSAKSSAGPRVHIDSSKLDGIRSAFTAELLRAVGSDEEFRLKELLDSGMDMTEKICGKNITAWCVEMGAAKCLSILGGTKSELEQEEQTEHDTSFPETEEREDEEENLNDQKQLQKHPNVTYAIETLRNLQAEVETNETLSSALSASVDLLAEEVSITQGLLMQQNDSTNTALLSQVRLLKQKRAGAEDEIALWESRTRDCEAEFNMVMMWWKNKGGSEQEVQDEFARVRKRMNSAASPSSSSMTNNPELVAEPETKSPDQIVREINATIVELETSRSNVGKLRKSMTYLAEDRKKNLEEIETLGLMGAVNLTRKLKDEVKEREEALLFARAMESEARMKVNVVRQMLENGTCDAEVADVNGDNDNGGVQEREDEEMRLIQEPISAEIERGGQEEVQPQTQSSLNTEGCELSFSQSRELRNNIIGEEDGKEVGNEEDRFHSMLERSMDEENHPIEEDSSYVSYSEESSHEGSDGDGSSPYLGSDEYNSSSSDDSDDDIYFESVGRSTFADQPHSEIIKGGFSNAITPYEDGIEGFLSKTRIWDLILRIVGLSRSAVEKTARATVEEIIPLPSNVMIV